MGVSAIAAASTSAVDLCFTHLPVIWFPFMMRKYCFEGVCLSLLYMMIWLPFIHSWSFWSKDTGFLMDPSNHRVHHSCGPAELGRQEGLGTSRSRHMQQD